MTAMNKRQLRAHLRTLHEGQAARDLQSKMLCKHILNTSEYRSSRVIGGYMPMLREADITPVLLDALSNGKTLALPFCADAPHMTMRLISSLNELIPGKYGIPEPASDAPIIPVDEIDLLLVPLEAIDQSGFRLGKGGGYYDCLLQNANVRTIGCALSWQWVDEVPRDSWDCSLKAAADQHGIHYFD